MDIILRIMRYIIIDDERHVRHIYPSRHDIRSDENIYFSVPKIQHHLIPLRLLEVGVHCTRVNLQGSQRARKILDTLLLTGKDNHFLQIPSLQRQLDKTSAPLRDDA